MTNQFLVQDQLLLTEIEGTPGTAETPTVSANAVKVGGLEYSLDFEVDPGDAEHTASLDGGDPIVLGGAASMRCFARMKGSGTAGVAPDYGALLRACGFAETLTASPVSDTSQAGGSSSTIKLHAGASATDDAYKGMVIEITSGSADGDVRAITAYDGTTKIATVSYDFSATPDGGDFTIYANALYVPASADLETVTNWAYQNSNRSGVDSIVRKLHGGMGNVAIEIGPRQVPVMNFTFAGILSAVPADVSRPGAATFDATEAPPFRGATSRLGNNALKFRRFGLDMGAQVQLGDDPEATYGMDAAATVRRAVGGSFNKYKTLAATYDPLTAFLAGTESAIWLRWGETAGNRLSILIPQAQYVGAGEESIDGFQADALSFRANGADSGVYICVY